MTQQQAGYTTRRFHDPIDDVLDRPIAFNPAFKKITGSTVAALMLSQAWYWSKRTSDEQGWFYKTVAEWEDETGLTRTEQETARKHLKDILDVELRGVPATLYYRIDKQKILELLGVQFVETLQTSLQETRELDRGIPANFNSTENTTENTQPDFSEIEEQANKKVDAYLQMANAPGIKQAFRIDSILSYIGGRLKINTETKAWRDFAKRADNAKQTEGQEVSVFFDWLLSQKGFDLSYWSPAKMWEHWPRAFAEPTAQDRPEYKPVPKMEGNFAPPPSIRPKIGGLS